MASLASIALLSFLGWAVWKLFREYLVSSPLDNIPGPERKSWLKGPTIPLTVVLGAYLS